MGRAVEFAEVVKAVERFGPLATLVTINGDRDPHVGTVLVTAADDHLVIRVGTRTRENVVSHPMVSLAWVVPDPRLPADHRRHRHHRCRPR